MSNQSFHNQLSPLTLGTWVFGGTSWGGGDSEESIRVIHAAIDAGVKCIDTAPIYSHGESERIIGKALVRRRDKVMIATKCGLKRGADGKTIVHDLSRSEILNQIEGSLRRLKTDYIDLYQCHAPDPDTEAEETMHTLLDLQKQGKIKTIGVSNFNPQQLAAFCDYGNIVTAQDQYSLLDRDVESELLPWVCQHDIGVLAYGPLAGGVLSGKYKERPDFGTADCRTFFYTHYQEESFNKARRVMDHLEKLGHPLSELALNWVRQQKGVTSVIVGCRDIKQLNANLACLAWELSEAELAQIRVIIDQ